MSYKKLSQYILSLITLATTAHAADPAPAPAATPYPLSICVVSGDKLGSMEAPTIIQYHGEEVQFCCKDCVKDFNKDPEKYMKRLHAAAAKKTPTVTPSPAATK